MVQVRGFLLACPSSLPLGAAVLSTVSCMQLSALLFFALLYRTLHSRGGVGHGLQCKATGTYL